MPQGAIDKVETLPAGPRRLWGDSASLRMLRRGASGAFAVTIVGTGLGFVVNLIVARLIGRADFGIYALMISWISVLSVVSQAGQDISIVRFIPAYIREGAWGKVLGMRIGVGLLVFAIATVVAIGGCVVVHLLGSKQPPMWRRTFYVGFALLPILTQLQQSGALHRAFKRPMVTGMYSTVARPAILMAAIGIMAYLVHPLDATWAAAANVVSALVALAASAWHMSRAWPADGRGAAAQYDIRRWAVVGSQMSLLSIIIVAGNWLDVLVLGAVMGTGDVGPYYAALRMANFALFAQQAVNVVLAPMIAERYDAGDLPGLQGIAGQAARLGFSGAVAIGIFFAVTGKWLLGLFGHGFEGVYTPLLLLLCGYCVSMSFGEVGFMMSMTKYQKQASVFVAIGITTNLVAAAILVPRLGATGAAIGSVLSRVVWRALAWRFVKKRLGIDPSIFGSAKKALAT